MKTNHLLLAAIFGFAFVFTLGCGGSKPAVNSSQEEQELRVASEKKQEKLEQMKAQY